MSFRLESVIAKNREQDQNSFWYRDSPHRVTGQSPIELDLAHSEECFTGDNQISVIIGKNGSGKSRILSSIAEVFAERVGDGGRSARSMDLEVTYSNLGKRHTLSSDETKQMSREAQKEARANTSRGPSRVIASTMTPFDKFRLSREVIRERVPAKRYNEAEFDERFFYCYAGLRDSNSRTDFKAFIFRSIKGIFLGGQRTEIQLHKLHNVFNFLGYKPEIEVVYKLAGYTYSNKTISLIQSHASFDEIIDAMRFQGMRTQFEYYFKKDPNALQNIRTAINKVLDSPRGMSYAVGRDEVRSFRVQLSANEVERDLLRDVFLLKDLRLLNLHDIRLTRSTDYNKINFLDASSGEISIVAGMLGIASKIEDNSLVLIDEPEISLHPEWQENYINLLRSTFSGFTGCHFIIATHSPLILSNIGLEGAFVTELSESGGRSIDIKQFSGASTDKILLTGFGVAGSNNLFLKQELIKAINLAATGKTSSEEFDKLRIFLMNARVMIDEKSNIAGLIDDLIDVTSDNGN